MSARHSKELRIYHARVKAWKVGRRTCECAALRTSEGELVCQMGAHPAVHCHHSRGRVGVLLLAEEFWVPLCEKAHKFAHDNPAEAKRLGLIGEGPWNSKPMENL